MKTGRYIGMVVVLLTLSSFSASAQMPSFPPASDIFAQEHREKLSPKQRAEQRTDEMDKAVNLNDKQYKKIYKIYLKEENAKASAMNNIPMGPPPGGMPPQGGGFPGAPGMGGFPDRPGAGGPPSGMPFPGNFGELQKPMVGGKEIDSDEYIDAREAKFKKILTPEQYAIWRRLHPNPYGMFVR